VILNSGEALPELPITTQVMSIYPCKRPYTHTNDDVGIAGINIGDLNAYTTISEKEIPCEGVIYRQQSDKHLDEAMVPIQLTRIQVLGMVITVEIP
jgi:hypothetical protein